MGETSPLSKADILRAFPDDDEADARQEDGELPAIPTRGRSSLVSRDATSILAPNGAASGSSAAPVSAPRAGAPVPQASRLSGFKLTKRRVDYTAVHQPPPSAKKRKEDSVPTPGTEPSAAAAAPTMGKGNVSSRTSPARSPSRDQEERRHEESAPEVPLAPEVPMSGSSAEVPKAQEPLVSQALVTASPPSPAAPLFPGSSASSSVLERALSEMTQLREDLLGADPRLELASGWLQSDAAVRATLSQAATTSEKEKRAAAQAAADREAAPKDAKAAHDHCLALEDELKSLHDERAEEARGRQAKEEEMRTREEAIKNRDAALGELAKTQAAERGRLEELERKVEAKKVDLDAKAKVLAEDRAAFALLEKRSHEALKSLYEKGLERPLTTDEDGPTQLLPYLVKVLEEVVEGIGPMAEA
nr:MAP7 domain-containing protein 1-like [Aegilops tauschii subsp. strangulata]